ncbi:MAG: glycosyltransferase family 2 protein [Planctomycetes bacterium]|nr:glycosyltransferase family 2 protein [Planctomycetota bacterium]
MQERPDLSIIAPFYNEEDNVASTIESIRAAMADFDGAWELILVNDGSTDRSFERAGELASDNPNVRVVGYWPNRGRGAALRRGFGEAHGRIVATVDFDLSYSPEHILRMYETLASEPNVDVVLASVYMPGGAVEGVPAGRFLASRLGNVLLRFAFGGTLHTTTCIVRAYRREVLDHLDLQSDRKEIHLEILSKALALGFRVKEIPATLRARAKGRSKFTLGRTSASHLLFAFAEEPMLLVAGIGAVLVLAGLAAAGVILYEWRSGAPGAAWVFIGLLALFGMGSALVAAFGFVAVELKRLRRSLIRLESQRHLRAESGRGTHGNVGRGRASPPLC